MWKLDVREQKGARACFIMLHGLGATTENFRDFFPALWQSRYGHSDPLRFIFPQAPNRPVTLHQGAVMPAWFDIFDIEKKAPQDTKGIPESAAMLMQLIADQEKEGISADRIFLSGFSQGGALALYTALRYPKTLGGIIGFGCYLPLMQQLKKECSAAARKTPIRLYHGSIDMVVPLDLAQESYSWLDDCRLPFELITETVEHTISESMLENAFSWVDAILITV
jgi:phospholipase/carboxylesterase